MSGLKDEEEEDFVYVECTNTKDGRKCGIWVHIWIPDSLGPNHFRTRPFWCGGCCATKETTWNDHSNELKEARARMQSQSKELSKVRAQIKGLDDALTRLKKDIEPLSASNELGKSNNKAFNYADIVKNSVQRPSKILEETKKEEAVQSKRKTNVIISGLKTDASVQDDKIFKEICECLKQPMNEDFSAELVGNIQQDGK